MYMVKNQHLYFYWLQMCSIDSGFELLRYLSKTCNNGRFNFHIVTRGIARNEKKKVLASSNQFFWTYGENGHRWQNWPPAKREEMLQSYQCLTSMGNRALNLKNCETLNFAYRFATDSIGNTFSTWHPSWSFIWTIGFTLSVTSGKLKLTLISTPKFLVGF